MGDHVGHEELIEEEVVIEEQPEDVMAALDQMEAEGADALLGELGEDHDDEEEEDELMRHHQQQQHLHQQQQQAASSSGGGGSSGHFYAIRGNQVFKIDRVSGAATPIRATTSSGAPLKLQVVGGTDGGKQQVFVPQSQGIAAQVCIVFHFFIDSVMEFLTSTIFSCIIPHVWPA